MTDTSEKEVLESLLFKSFRSLLADFPHGSVIDNRQAEGGPDYFVEHGGRRVGMEITRIFLDGDTVSNCRRTKESLWERVVSQVRSEWSARGTRPLDVKVTFDDQEHIAKKDVSALASWLANLVRNHAPIESGRVELPPTDSVLEDWPPVVQGVTISVFPYIDETLWSVADAAWIPTLPPAELQIVIDRKANRLPSYRAKCCEAWLVIGADQVGFSSFFKGPVGDHEYKSNFDRVYLLERVSSTLRELSIRPEEARTS
jgi:hypothetical protein